MADQNGLDTVDHANTPETNNTEDEITEIDKEELNYTRLVSLLVNNTPVALRHVFNQIHPPMTLVEKLARPDIHKPLRRLKVQGVISGRHWGVLYPMNKRLVTSGQYDSVLLLILLKKVCHLTAPYPSGWYGMPDTKDKSLAADVVRLTQYRNAVFNMPRNLSDKDFKAYYSEMSAVLTRLGGQKCSTSASEIKTKQYDAKGQEEVFDELNVWHEDSIEVETIEHKIDDIVNLRGSSHDFAKVANSSFGPMSRKNTAATFDARSRVSSAKVSEAESEDTTKSSAKSALAGTHSKSHIAVEQDIVYDVTKVSEKEVLEKFHKHLTEKVKSDDVVGKLVQRGILSHEEKNKIMLTLDSRGRMRIVVELLNKKGGKAFDTFLDVIKFKYKSLYNQMVDARNAPKLVGRPDDMTECRHATQAQIKAIYSHYSPVPWHEFYTPLHEFFIQPYVTDQEGRLLEPEAIFSKHSKCEHPKRVLLEGMTGTGKSTYLKNLVYEWSRGNLKFNDRFKLILMIDVQRAGFKDLPTAILEQCLPLSYKKGQSEISKVLEQHQEDILIILDGIEDASSECRMLDLIYNNPYPKSSLLLSMTSTHVTTSFLKNFDTRLVIMGMYPNTQDELIKTYASLSKNGRELFEPLLGKIYDERSNVVKNMSQNPLYCLCMCLIAEFEGSFDFTTPSFMLQNFFLALQRLYCNQNSWPLTKDSDIPDHVSKLSKTLEEVALLAANENTAIFRTDALQRKYGTAEFINLGMMTSYIQGQRSKPIEFCFFSFKMFRQFLAAKCLAKLDIDQFQQYIPKLLNQNQFQGVAIFFCGLLRFDYHIRTMQELFISMGSANRQMRRGLSFAITKSRSSKRTNQNAGDANDKFEGRLLDFQLSLSCLNECEGREDVTKFIVEALPRRLYMRSKDILNGPIIGGLTQVIKANVKPLEDLDLRIDHIGLYYQHQMALLGKQIERSHCIENMRIRWTNENLLGIFLANIFGNNMSITSLKIYDESYSRQDNVSATVWNNLWTAKSGMQYIRTFAFTHCRNPALVTSIIRNSPDSLEAVYLNNCAIDLIGAQELAQKLENDKRLHSLNLHHIKINKAAFLYIASSLKHSKTITELIVSDTDLDTQCIVALTEALKFNKSLKRLDLSNNTLTLEACQALGSMLAVNVSVIDLLLHGCSVGPVEAIELRKNKRPNVLIAGIDQKKQPTFVYSNGDGVTVENAVHE